MSSSKIYEKTEDFKPEEIVKQTTDGVADWQAVPTRTEESFKTLETSPPQVNNNIDKAPVPPPIPEPQQGSQEVNQQPQEPQPKTTPTTPPKSNQPAKEQPQIKKQETPTALPQDVIPIAEAEQKIEEAYRQGIEETTQRLEEDFGSATRALVSCCQQIDTIRETIINNSSSELQEFALAIAERILRISLREQDKTIILTIEEALHRAVRSEDFTIYIHPDDYQVISEKTDELVSGVTGLNNIILKQDITVERGGVKIESDNCTIDATISSQFDVIREEVKKQV